MIPLQTPLKKSSSNPKRPPYPLVFPSAFFATSPSAARAPPNPISQLVAQRPQQGSQQPPHQASQQRLQPAPSQRPSQNASKHNAAKLPSQLPSHNNAAKLPSKKPTERLSRGPSQQWYTNLATLSPQSLSQFASQQQQQNLHVPSQRPSQRTFQYASQLPPDNHSQRPSQLAAHQLPVQSQSQRPSQRASQPLSPQTQSRLSSSTPTSPASIPYLDSLDGPLTPKPQNIHIAASGLPSYVVLGNQYEHWDFTKPCTWMGKCTGCGKTKDRYTGLPWPYVVEGEQSGNESDQTDKSEQLANYLAYSREKREKLKALGYKPMTFNMLTGEVTIPAGYKEPPRPKWVHADFTTRCNGRRRRCKGCREEGPPDPNIAAISDLRLHRQLRRYS